MDDKYSCLSSDSDDGNGDKVPPQPSRRRQEPVEKDEDNLIGNDKEENDVAIVPIVSPKNQVLEKNIQPEGVRSFIPPRINCPEKIILCIDVSAEMNLLPFETADGSVHDPLSIVRRIIEFFVLSKSRIDDRHEYALIVLQEHAVWLKDFINDPKDFLETINDVQDTYICDTMNFTSLLDLICEKITLPVVENHSMPPPYTVRVIMLYTRSTCIPEIEIVKESHEKLRSSEYFFFDVFYVHLPPTEENNCQEIYDFFCNLDERGTYYILEEVRNITRLHCHMVKFLAHPLQRLPQGDDNAYSIVAR